jgi:predicted nucleic acid-binding Zn ribbon protein
MPEKAFKDLHSILTHMLDDFGLTEKVSEERILQQWTSITGGKISKMCKPVSFHHGELTIKAKDKFWRDELAHRQHDLLNLLDKWIERSLVKKINII